jgi:MFS family permease
MPCPPGNGRLHDGPGRSTYFGEDVREIRSRLGIGGVPFLLPLLYQVGLGFSPVQSGLLIMPQVLAAMSMKGFMPRLLALIGYRWVLISNTVLLGLLLMLFATVGLHTSVWLIVIQACLYGAFTSLQYSSMNTLVYADTTEQETSAASSIASTIAADVDQFRRRDGGIGDSLLRSQPRRVCLERNDPRYS